MSEQKDNALDRLKSVAKHTHEYLTKLSDTAERASELSSPSLLGTAGGILGTAVGVLVAHFTGVSLLLISTPLTALGIVSGILFFRGRRRINLERRIEENRLAAEEIIRRIDEVKKIPGTPQHVIDELWESFTLLTKGYDTQAALLLGPPNDRSQGNAALPAPPPEVDDGQEDNRRLEK